MHRLRWPSFALVAVLILDPAVAQTVASGGDLGPVLARSPWQESSDPSGLRYQLASTEEALRESFPQASQFLLQPVTLDREQRAGLQKQLRGPLARNLDPVYLAYGSDETFVGYAVVTGEIGKYRPITMLISFTPDEKVNEVQILVYRESRGMDVRRSRFLRQFKDKGSEAAMRVGQDIVNVTGATLSTRAVTRGVWRVLATLHAVYDGVPPTLAEAQAASIGVVVRQ